MIRRFQNLRYSLRQLQLNPTFALVMIGSLALGIGANTAVFQLLDAVRLRSLPVVRPQELAEIRIVGGNKGFGISNGIYSQLTRPIWKQIKQNHEPFTGIFAWTKQDQRIGRGIDSQPVSALEVSGEFFPVLGIQPWRGRLFRPEDEAEQCTITQLVVSYPYWQNQMGGRELSGHETLVIEGNPAQVVGVTPPGFFGLAVGESFDIAFPFCREKETRADLFDVSIMGRLRPGWSIERAFAYMNALSGGIFETTAPTGYSAQSIQHFKQYKLGVYTASAGVSYLRMKYSTSLWLLLIMTGLVLLIACANLANLMLARASAREREFAVRLALGASRTNLLWQSLTESSLLALIGTTLGIGLAQILSRALVWVLSNGNDDVALHTSTDWRVLLFAALIATLTCVIFGIAPAFRSMRAQPANAIKSGSGSLTGSRERFSLQRLMVVMQISVSLVLLVGAILFVRSFRSLMTLDPGMREQGITRVFVGFADAHISPNHFEEFKQQLLDEVRSVPGVLNAASTTRVPLLGGSWTLGVHMGAMEDSSRFTWVSPGYFKTMAIPLRTGRDFNENDTANSTPVAVVNQTFVRKFVAGGNPIGQTFRSLEEPGYPPTVFEIVGIIPDTKYNDIRDDVPPMTFVPAAQYTARRPWTQLMIYSETDPENAIKQKIASLHPEVVMQFSNFQQDIQGGLVRERLLAMLSGFFGFLAALLAMVGLYGLIAYIVARRIREIGIRVALGADRARIVAMVMHEAARLLLIGLAVGTGLVLIAGRGAASLLFGLKPHDPVTLLGSIGLLAAIAALASFVPARRAAKIDPMVALRYE
ncbi:MAG TPA: ABC transporter permease [Terriglobales bacterium]|nr:ABC transporter permease [Terriglobales bacterium]